MLTKIARSFAKSDTVKATKYVQDHAIMTNRQLDMMRDHMKINTDLLQKQIDTSTNLLRDQIKSNMNINIFMISGITAFFGYTAYSFDKRLDKIDTKLDNLSNIIINKFKTEFNNEKETQ
jgi:hypothetical protein